MKKLNYRIAIFYSTMACMMTSSLAYAQAEEGETSGVGDIIVTAQKRAQSINEVPLSITAISGDALIQQGISSPSDLAKIVPGLTAQPSPLNTPVYTLRGVGFFEYSLAATSTVAVYIDEVPLPFPAMTKGAALDLERVEVLKGPQGTLFGQNATGGAINFIAAKPTKDFTAGMDVSYGRFDAVDVQGFVSGPITETLGARVAVRTIQGGAWQSSYTRDDTLGERRETQGRILLDWLPTDRLKLLFSASGWIDKSDSQAPQLIGSSVNLPSNVELSDAINNYPRAPRNARAADWSDDILPLRHDDSFYQLSLRADYDLTDSIQLTSITAYERYKTDSFQDYDASSLHITDVRTGGYVKTLSQELRLSGKIDKIEWMVGANYQKDQTFDEQSFYIGDSTTSFVSNSKTFEVGHFTEQDVKTIAVFGNVEYKLTDQFTLFGGGRYTDSKRSFAGCAFEPEGLRGIGRTFENLQADINPLATVVPILGGDCYTFDEAFVPIIDPLRANLNEDNVSWRLGLRYEMNNRGMLYGSVSRGYKSGSFPTVPAGTVGEYDPVLQEKLTAYEIGFKQPLFDRKVQMNGAVFYYDYTDKQLRGRINNIVFGPLEALVQIPESRVWGAELQITAQPIKGLDLNAAATYLDTKITNFRGYNQAGTISDFSGSRFPFSPKWMLVGDGQYTFPITGDMQAFFGMSATYNSATSASIGDVPQLEMKGYVLVDARAGFGAKDGRWQVSLWGRNIFNEYYWVSANKSQDVFIRYAGKPVTYGLALKYRFD